MAICSHAILDLETSHHCNCYPDYVKDSSCQLKYSFSLDFMNFSFLHDLYVKDLRWPSFEPHLSLVVRDESQWHGPCLNYC